MQLAMTPVYWGQGGTLCQVWCIGTHFNFKNKQTKKQEQIRSGVDVLDMYMYLKRTALYDDCDDEEQDAALGCDEVSDLEYELSHRLTYHVVSIYNKICLHNLSNLSPRPSAQ